MQDTFDLGAVGRLWGMGIPWLSAKCESGGIRAERMGGEWYISRATLEKMSGVSIGEMERVAAARNYGSRPKPEAVDARTFIRKALGRADGQPEGQAAEKPPKPSAALARVSSFTYVTVSKAKESKR